jgi:hypothetical protein
LRILGQPCEFQGQAQGAEWWAQIFVLTNFETHEEYATMAMEADTDARAAPPCRRASRHLF